MLLDEKWNDKIYLKWNDKIGIFQAYSEYDLLHILNWSVIMLVFYLMNIIGVITICAYNLRFKALNIS